MNKGMVKYVPPKVLEELNNIKTNYNLTDARAFEKMAEFVPIGMEIEKMRERIVLADLFKRKKNER